VETKSSFPFGAMDTHWILHFVLSLSRMHPFVPLHVLLGNLCGKLMACSGSWRRGWLVSGFSFFFFFFFFFLVIEFLLFFYYFYVIFFLLFLIVKLNGSRKVTGVLRGFDPFLNIVLDDAMEEVSATERHNIGMIVRCFFYFT